MPYKDRTKQLACQRNWIRQRRLNAIAEFGGQCVKCGSKQNLEFDHIDPKTKLACVAEIWTWAEDRRLAELAKCQLLCTYCHKEKTAVDRGYKTAPHGTLTSYKRYGCRCELCRSANAGYEHGRRLQLRTYEVASGAGGLGARLPDISTINPQDIQECVACGDA